MDKRTKGASAVAQRTDKRKKRKPVKTEEVIYSQAKPFSKEKLILRLATVVAVVVALVLGLSIFFKVEKIEVSGTLNYTPWDVMQASQIQIGENLLTLNKPSISSKILQSLQYVDSVRIDITLPDTVRIEIAEEDVYYSIEASDGSWWLMDDSGKILDKTNAADAADHTKVLGVQLDTPAVGQMAKAYESAPEPEATGEVTQPTVPVTVFASERLEVALTIAQCMESNGVLGGITSLDVTNLGDIVMQYGDIYRIELGDTTQMPRKISAMRDTLEQHGDSYQGGTMDVSFTTWPDSVGLTPDLEE